MSLADFHFEKQTCFCVRNVRQQWNIHHFQICFQLHVFIAMFVVIPHLSGEGCSVRFYGGLLLFLLLFLRLLLLLLLASSAGPQLRLSALGVPCRTSTATLCPQCSLPDLNRDSLRSVFPAGPQPQDRMSEGMSERMSDRMSVDMSERMSSEMSSEMSERLSEHYAAQAALMSIETVIHLKKPKRFLDVHLPEITTAMRMCTPTSPLSVDHLHQLRSRRIENCKKELETDLFKHGHVVGMYWENIARSMVERAHRDAQQLDVPLFCL